MARKLSVKIAPVLTSHLLFPAVPSSLPDKQAWPPADPGFYSASHIPNTTASWVLIAESSLPGMIETIKRTQLNFSHPAGWAQGPALLRLPPASPQQLSSVHVWSSFCGRLWVVDRCYLAFPLNLAPWKGGLMTMMDVPGLPSWLQRSERHCFASLTECLAWSHPEVRDRQETAIISLHLLGPHDNILVTLSANEPFSVTSFLSLVPQQAFIKHLLSAQYWVHCSEERHREARGYQGI